MEESSGDTMAGITKDTMEIMVIMVITKVDVTDMIDIYFNKISETFALTLIIAKILLTHLD
jgi:hypothetical protein